MAQVRFAMYPGYPAARGPVYQPALARPGAAQPFYPGARAAPPPAVTGCRFASKTTPHSAIAVKFFKREFGVLGPKTNKREFDKNEKCLKKIEKRLNFLSENSVFWGPKLISNYSRQLRIGEYSHQKFPRV